MVARISIFLLLIAATGTVVFAQKWPEGKAPIVPNADPYVRIQDAALSPARSTTYSAVFDATRLAKDPGALVPGVNAVGGLLNDLGVSDVPLSNAHFVVVFHGPATDAILVNEKYRAKYGIDNPNLSAISKMKKMGVEFYVCGQHLASSHIDPSTLTKDVTIAADAFLVLIGFQNKGYGVMFF